MGLYSFTNQTDANRILDRLKRLEPSIPRLRGGKLVNTQSNRRARLDALSMGFPDGRGRLIVRPDTGLHCVMLGTEIESIDGEEYETRHYHENHWWYIRDSEMHWINCTYNHRLYDAEGFPKQAQDFEIGDVIVHRRGNFEVVESNGFPRVCTKIQVMMKRVHLFWANGFLSHNIKMDPL
jgi:hypothetical protein